MVVALMCLSLGSAHAASISIFDASDNDHIVTVNSGTPFNVGISIGLEAGESLSGYEFLIPLGGGLSCTSYANVSGFDYTLADAPASDSLRVGGLQMLSAGKTSNFLAETLTLAYTGSAKLTLEPIEIQLYNANVEPLNITSIQGLSIQPASVPIPAAFLLFGSGLLGLIGLRRRS